MDTHHFGPNAIVNMDETPIWADMPGVTTISKTGTKMIPIRTTGHEKNRLTVCLAAKADGTKMPPYIVITRKKFPAELSNISGVVVACSDNGWMNDDLTIDWVNRVWGNFGFGKRFLVWDSFKCHLSDQVKDALKRRNTVKGVIPGGCTKLLQPVDVSMNKPVKDAYRENYEKWFAAGDFEYTRGGNIKAPSFKSQIEWILAAWNTLSPDIVRKSFVTCGISSHNIKNIHCLQPDQPAHAAAAIVDAAVQQEMTIELEDEVFIVEKPSEDYDDDDIMELQQLDNEELLNDVIDTNC